MTMTTIATATERGLLATVLAYPGESGPMLVYADYLDEHDRANLAFAYRWMARYAKRPLYRDQYRYVSQPSRAVPMAYRWCWFPEKNYSPVSQAVRHPPYEARLPRIVFLSFAGYPQGHRFYGGWERAVDDLAEGLRRMKVALSLERDR